MPTANMIGAYGEWAAEICAQPQRLPQAESRRRYNELLLQPDTGGTPQASVQHHIDFDGLAIEQVQGGVIVVEHARQATRGVNFAFFRALVRNDVQRL